MDVFIFQGPEKTSPVANDLIVIGDTQDLNVESKPKRKISKLGNLSSLAVGSYTYDEIEDIINDPDQGLSRGHYYEITDATPANIPLLLFAISTTQFHTEAKSPDFPQDVIEYQFSEDLILWRWDTINDVSVAQDLRNLQGLTLGDNIAHIHGGSGLTGVIGDGSTDIITGANCTLNIFQGKNLNFGSNIDFSNPAHPTYGCDFFPQSIDSILVVVDDLLDGCVFRTNVNIAVASNKQLIYDYGGEIRNAGGDPVLIYVDFDDNNTLKTAIIG